MSNAAPPNFLIYNDQQVKQINIVVEIEGVPGLLTAVPLYTRISYGDPIVYGEPGLVYGGLRRLTEYNGGLVQDILSLDASSLTLQQRVEPEQGRASISVLNFGFIDKNEYMTELCSPGRIVDDILGKKIKVYLGFTNNSFPGDYYVIFRGIISNIEQPPGMCKLTLSDPNIKRRTQCFFSGKSKLTSAINNAVTTIPVDSNSDFFKSVLNLSGGYDSAVKLYLKIDDEYIEYGPTASLPSAVFGVNSFSGVVRGSRGSTPSSHDSQADVDTFVEIYDHAIDMALKIMLSGWGTDCTTDIPLASINLTGLVSPASYPNSIVLPNNIDAVRDYGIFPGDQITITGNSIPANNQTCLCIGFQDLNDQTNRVILTDGTFTDQYPGDGTWSIRSQYDTYPLTCGTKLQVDDVDVARHIEIKEQFLSVNENSYRFFIGAPETAKTFIESEIYLPLACYSLTRFGRLSMGLTKPPIAEASLQFLTEDNITNAQNLTVQRGLTNRKFFNEVDWEYDYLDDGSKYTTVLKTLDSDSLNIIGIGSILPIKSKGIRTDLNPSNVIQRRTKFLLSRYKRGAVMINPEVNYATGVLIEAGDVVAVEDNGTLQIANYTTGERNIGTQLFEVIDRTLDLKNGNVKLQLLSGVQGLAEDRYGTISPSSRTDAGTNYNSVIIKDSYGAKFPGNEKAKWEDYINLPVLIHDDDYTNVYERTLTGFSNVNPYQMNISPALPVVIPAGWVVDIAKYPTDADTYTNATYKQIHAFLDPTVFVATGVSTTKFTVAPADITKFKVGAIVIVHQENWSYYSPEVLVSAIDTGTYEITVDEALGFTPAVGDFIELIGFADSGAPYRFV